MMTLTAIATLIPEKSRPAVTTTHTQGMRGELSPTFHFRAYRRILWSFLELCLAVAQPGMLQAGYIRQRVPEYHLPFGRTLTNG
jgi:hypothetical protein